MKICIIAGRYFKSEDGIGRYTSNLLNYIKVIDNKTKLKVVSYDNSSKTSSCKIINTSIVPIKIKKLLNPIITELNYFSRFNKNRTLLVDKLRGINAQIYHAISPSESAAAIILNKRPLITTFHDLIPLVSETSYLFEEYYCKYYCNLAKKSDIILVNSKNTKKDLTQILNIPDYKIKVIYPGIDTKKFYPIQKKNKVDKCILYLGGLLKRKGVYEILYAFDKLVKIRRDVKLLIGGSGVEFYNLQEEVNRLKINEFVNFLGFIDEKKLVDYYHLADLFIYPSKYEGFGFTPLEAMTCGVPVLTSDSSSIPEVVGDAAIKVDPNNIEELCSKMNLILDDSELQDKMRRKGLIQAKKYSWEKCASETLKVYKSLI